MYVSIGVCGEDLEKDMLDGCGLYIYAFLCLWLRNQHADRLLE